MDVLAPIPYVLWVHGQGLTSLGHNQYTMRILFIQVSEYPWLWALVAMPKSDISGVVEVVWCHWHSSMPLWWCWNIHLRPIPSVLQHQGVMVGLTWPSTPCIYPLIMGYGPGYATIWYIWGGLSLRCMVPLSWLKASIMVLEHSSGTYIKCVTTPGSNDLAHMTLNITYLPLTLGPGYATIWFIWGGWSCVVPLQANENKDERYTLCRGGDTESFG